MAEVRKQREKQDWFTDASWREKGVPEEQLEFQINGRQVTVYNWNKEKPFDAEHVDAAKRIFAQLASRFPQILKMLRWVLIDDNQPPSVYGDPDRYPFNGKADDKWRAFTLYPRGMELIPHRIAKATNFEGTLTHELTHLNQSDFLEEWGEKYWWKQVTDDKDYEDEWEQRPTPDGRQKRLFNKKIGEMCPWGQIPLQQDECVTSYAKITIAEDICESMVAYIYDPELLKRISPTKYEILRRHDAGGEIPEVTASKVPQEAIKLPEVKAETVKYYVRE